MHARRLVADIPLDPSVPEALVRNREALVRRWLALVVERSSFEDLAERPLGERVRELDLLWEAAGHTRAPTVPEPAPAEAMGEGPEAIEGPAAPVTPLFRQT